MVLKGLAPVAEVDAVSASALEPAARKLVGNCTRAFKKLTKLVEPGKVRSGTSKFSSSYSTPFEASGLKDGPNALDGVG